MINHQPSHSITSVNEVCSIDVSPEFEESKVRRLEREENDFEKAVREEFYRELKSHPAKYTRGVKNILAAERVVSLYTDAKREEKGFEAARKFFNKGSWR
jgi:hypothetical protein